MPVTISETPQGVEKHSPKNALAAYFTVDKRSQNEPKDNARKTANAEDEHIL